MYADLPADTRRYYDRICATRHNIDLTWKEQLQRLGIGLLQAPEKILSNILSPEGLEMLGIFLGIDLAGKAALNGILRGIARGVGSEVMKIAEEQAVKQGALFINNVILATVLGSAVEEGTVAAAAFAVTEAVSSAVGVITAIVAIIQFLGMLIDMWDPLGYGQEVNADTMEIINNEFDTMFASKYLETLTVGKDRFGRPIHLSQLPVEYRMDIELMADKSPGSDYERKLYTYTFQYLNALKYNSDGEAMRPRPKEGQVLDPNIFKRYANSLAFQLEGRNVEVARWTRGNVLLVALGIGILLFILFKR